MLSILLNMVYFVTPRGIRIPVTSVKGRCPRPLDDGGFFYYKNMVLNITSIVNRFPNYLFSSENILVLFFNVGEAKNISKISFLKILTELT